MGLTAAQARAGAGPMRRVDGRTPYGDGAGGGSGIADGGYGPMGRRIDRGRIGGGAGPIGDGGAGPAGPLPSGGTEYGPSPRGQLPRASPTSRPTAEQESARRLATQETQANDAGTQLLNDLLLRVTETINRVSARRAASVIALTAPLSAAPSGGTAADVMDAREQAKQDAAMQADENVNDMSLRPVKRSVNPKPVSKAHKSDTGITKRRQVTYDRSLEAKKVNK